MKNKGLLVLLGIVLFTFCCQQVTSSNVTCPAQGTAKIPHPLGICFMYQLCEGGQVIGDGVCEIGTHFDLATRSCIVNSNASECIRPIAMQTSSALPISTQIAPAGMIAYPPQVQLCPAIGNITIAHPDTSQCYVSIECREGETVRILFCAVGSRYDPATSSCKVATAATECKRLVDSPTTDPLYFDDPVLCPASVNSVNISRPPFCHRYVECVQGTVKSISSCPIGMRFDPEQLICISATEKECSRSIYVGPPQIYPYPDYLPPLSSDCPPTGDVLVPHPSICYGYLNCSAGRVIDKNLCAVGELFDRALHACRTANESECRRPPDDIPSYYPYPYYPFYPGLDPNFDLSSQCPPTGTANVTHPYDCSQFLECVDGQVRRYLSCDVGKLFDGVQQVCKPSADVACTTLNRPILYGPPPPMPTLCPATTGPSNVSYPGVCYLYMTCLDGVYTGEGMCDVGMTFDPVQGKCRFPATETECRRTANEIGPIPVGPPLPGGIGGIWPVGSGSLPPYGSAWGASIGSMGSGIAWNGSAVGGIMEGGTQTGSVSGGIVIMNGSTAPSPLVCPTTTGPSKVSYPGVCYFYMNCLDGVFAGVGVCDVGMTFDPVQGKCRLPATETECRRPADRVGPISVGPPPPGGIGGIWPVGGGSLPPGAAWGAPIGNMGSGIAGNGTAVGGIAVGGSTGSGGDGSGSQYGGTAGAVAGSGGLGGGTQTGSASGGPTANMGGGGTAVQTCPGKGCPNYGLPSSALYLPDPTDCQKYRRCYNGVYETGACPPGLHFNPVSQVCELPQYAGCAVVATTPRPPC